MDYARAEGIGDVWLSQSPVRTREEQTQPDLAVRPPVPKPLPGWTDFPVPMLVVEVSSPGTARHDEVHKRQYYKRLGVDEYWTVDPKSLSITVARPDSIDRSEHARVVWHPKGASTPLSIDVAALFAEALGK